jgi:FdhD protein
MRVPVGRRLRIAARICHNALDKLSGAVTVARLSVAAGAVLLTSRVSVEMVQKVASLGAPILVAVSAPTALALRAADGFETFTHPQRIL